MKCDVRDQINWIPKEKIDLIANFAAIHREPGHNHYEYYDTNIKGAENVCNWASHINCKKLIFTSSISPYGTGEAIKTERSTPQPNTAYGSSKLAAEKIHQIWQSSDNERQLVIVRPGVVFGPSENGNVSRLIHAVRKRYFFYMGNKNTCKAGVYVKELCKAMMWVLKSKKAKFEKFTLFNMSMNPQPSVQDYVDTIIKVSNIKIFVPHLPKRLLLVVSYFIEAIAKPLRINQPFSPVRIRKLALSNNIEPSYLLDQNYKFEYSLEDAFRDWKKECPNEWI